MPKENRKGMTSLQVTCVMHKKCCGEVGEEEDKEETQNNATRKPCTALWRSMTHACTRHKGTGNVRSKAACQR